MIPLRGLRMHRGLLVLAVFLGFLSASACGGKAKPAAAPAGVPARVARAESASVPVTRRAVGNVEADVTAPVLSRVSGRVLSRHFEEGQDVAEGQLLFTIDPAPFEQALRSAEAKEARDQATLEFQRADAKRFEGLVAQNAVSRSEAEQRSSASHALEQVVRAGKVDVEKARLDLSWCSVRSPIAGRTGRFLANLGTTAEALKTPLVVVNRVHPAKVAFSLPESSLPEVRQLLKSAEPRVSVSVPGTSLTVTGGRLAFLDNAVDAGTGMVRLKALFQNSDGALWPGQFVEVTLLVGTEEGAVVVPSVAVESGPKGKYVVAVGKDGTAEMRPVEVDRVESGKAVVRKGLAAGDTVVVEGQNKLRPGSKVAPVEEPASTAVKATAGGA